MGLNRQFKPPSFGSGRWSLTAVIFAIVATLFLGTTPSVAADAGSTWMCWHSDWGNPDLVYALDAGDYSFLLPGGDGRLVRADVSAPHTLFAGQHAESVAVAPFDSLRSLVDVGHAFDFSPFSSDMGSLCQYDAMADRIRNLLTDRGECLEPGADPSVRYNLSPRTPWGASTSEFTSNYLPYRRVNLPDEGRARLTSYSGQWLDTDNPSGGVQRDDAQFLHDLLAGVADIAIASRQSAHGGGRRLTLVGSFPTITITSTTTVTCTYGGGSCSSNTLTESSPASVDLHFQGTDINNGEYFDTEFVVHPDGRLIQRRQPDGSFLPENIRVDPSYIGESTLQDRVGSLGSGYSFLSQRQVIGGDELHVNLTLDPTHRTDYAWEFGSVDPQVTVLPAFGSNPWLFTQHGAPVVGRYHPGLSEAEQAHRGFRHPVLDEAFPLSTPGVPDDDDSLRRVRWPANLEDLSWHLFSLPVTLNSPDDDNWLLFNSPEGAQALVDAGFQSGSSSSRLSDPCEVAGTGASRTDISCENVQPSAFFPFQRTGSGPAFGDLTLVSSGVASPVDVNSSSVRSLNQFSFIVNESRVFADSVASSSDAAATDRLGVPHHPEARSAYVSAWPCIDGVSPCASSGDAAADLNPNSPYLLVISFFESRNPFSYDLSSSRAELRFVGPGGSGDLIRVPKRQVRRVVCRLAVLPSFYSGSVDSEPSRFLDTLGQIGSALGSVASIPGAVGGAVGGAVTTGLSALVEGVFKSFALGTAQAPSAAINEVSEATCGALDQLAVASNGGPVRYEQPVEVRGDLLVHNAVADSVAYGVETCQKVRVDEPVTCSSSAGVAYVSDCLTLPSLVMEVQDVDFVSLEGDRSDYRDSVLPMDVGSRKGESRNGMLDWFSFPTSTEQDDDVVNRLGVDLYRPFLGASFGQFSEEDSTQVFSYGHDITASNLQPGTVDDAFFEEVPGSPSDEELPESFTANPFNSGLALVRVGWKYRWHKDVTREVFQSIDGVVLSIAAGNRVSPTGDHEIRNFFLPRELSVDDVPEGDVYLQEVDHVWFGSLGMLPFSLDPEQELFNPLFRFPGSFRGYTGQAVADIRHDFKAPSSVLSDLSGSDGLYSHALSLPVAPGFNYTMWVTPYVGVPGKDGDPPRLGAPSEPLSINGSRMACLARDSAGEFEDRRIPLLYGCQDKAAGPTYSPPADVLSESFAGLTLLNVTGTSICTDFLTATPAALTWDNSVVRSMWGFMWLLAGAVFFTLLVWQGLRMTYDFGLDPRASVGLREFIPRALLALILAGTSLYLVQIALVLASDLTCLVAQYTGMSLWGIWGQVFGILLDAMAALFDFATESGENLANAIATGVAAFILGKITLAAILLVVLFIFLFLLYVFGKVVFGLLIRLALLAVLIVFAPLAFVFYSSPSTSHWTAKWISMFLGTLFQQVTVIIVLYVGLHFVDGYFESTQSDSFMEFAVAVVMAFAVFFLAGKAGDLVNPASRGVFDGFGSLLMMAGAAALSVATMGAGFAAGFAGAGSGGGGAMGLVRGGGSPLGGGVRTGPRGGGGDDGGGGGTVNAPDPDPQSGAVSTRRGGAFSPFGAVRSMGFNFGRRSGGQSVTMQVAEESGTQQVSTVRPVATVAQPSAEAVGAGVQGAEAAVGSPAAPLREGSSGRRPDSLGHPAQTGRPLPGQRDPGAVPPSPPQAPHSLVEATVLPGQLPPPPGSASPPEFPPDAPAPPGLPGPAQDRGVQAGAPSPAAMPVVSPPGGPGRRQEYSVPSSPGFVPLGGAPGRPGGPSGPPAPLAHGQSVGSGGFTRAAVGDFPVLEPVSYPPALASPSFAGLPGLPDGPEGPPAPGLPGGPPGVGPDAVFRAPPGVGGSSPVPRDALANNRAILGLGSGIAQRPTAFDNAANVQAARGLAPAVGTARGGIRWSAAFRPVLPAQVGQAVRQGRPFSSVRPPVLGVSPGSGPLSSGVLTSPGGLPGVASSQPSPSTGVAGESSSPAGEGSEGTGPSSRPGAIPTPSSFRGDRPSFRDRVQAGLATGRAWYRRSQTVNRGVRDLVTGNFAYPGSSFGDAASDRRQVDAERNRRRDAQRAAIEQSRFESEQARAEAQSAQLRGINDTLNRILDGM